MRKSMTRKQPCKSAPDGTTSCSGVRILIRLDVATHQSYYQRIIHTVFITALVFANFSCTTDRVYEEKPSLTTGSMTLGERKLIQIQKDQEAIFKRIEESDDTDESGNLELSVRHLMTEYESYLAENPEDVLCLILYGKLLRKIDRLEDAQLVFLKANSLDPNLAVVKQQLGNYHAEIGNFEEALGYFLIAVELSPDTALYTYQLGELLYQFRDLFLTSGMFNRDTLDRQISKAFAESARLDSDNIDFQFRYAESFYDLENPDWNAALEAWEAVGNSVNSEVEIAAVLLHKANIYIKLKEPEKAREIIDNVNLPELAETKEQLLKQLP
jgi:tetratricopeptide (TPR) repeat protein